MTPPGSVTPRAVSRFRARTSCCTLRRGVDDADRPGTGACRGRGRSRLPGTVQPTRQGAVGARLRRRTLDPGPGPDGDPPPSAGEPVGAGQYAEALEARATGSVITDKGSRLTLARPPTTSSPAVTTTAVPLVPRFIAAPCEGRNLSSNVRHDALPRIWVSLDAHAGPGGWAGVVGGMTKAASKSIGLRCPRLEWRRHRAS